MRNALLTLLLAALVLPAAALASRAEPTDGTLSVEGASGTVIVQARGAVIGRVAAGTVVITDLSPGDDSDPVVWGAQTRRQTGRETIAYRGRNITFRLIGGGFKVVVRGVGISLSVVGRGDAYLAGDATEAGVFSTSGADCRFAPETCRPLPDGGQRIKIIGAPTSQDRSSGPAERTPPPPVRPQSSTNERTAGPERTPSGVLPAIP